MNKRFLALATIFILTLSGYATNAIARTFVVQEGDSLWDIPKQNALLVEELKELSNIDSSIILPNEQSNANDEELPKAVEKTFTMEATAYTAYCEGCSGITANGTDLRSNPELKVIAVDPSVIPLGTEVWVEGYGKAIAADTGGAIKGNKIDVFIPSEKDAHSWGRKTVTVKILN